MPEAEGYLKGNKPDVGWWREQVTSGIEYRKKSALESKWPTWRNYYRGRWASGILPIQLFFSMLRSMVPRVYFRNPAVSVMPDMPGMLMMAFAQILNRIDNKLLQAMNLKREMKDMTHDTFIMGTAVGKLGYGGQFTPSILEGTEIPEGPTRGERLEYHSDIYGNMPWFLRCDPGTFVVPDGLRRMHEARWAAHIIRRPKDDVARDPRFPKSMRENIPSTYALTTATGYSKQVPIEMVELMEIRDRKFGRVLIIVPAGSKDGAVLYDEDDPLQDRRLPFFPVVFNPDDECFWGVPDAQILEPSQLEGNETRTLMMKHRRQTIIKLLYANDALTPVEIGKMQSEDVLAAVKVASGNVADVVPLQAADIPQSLFLSLQTIYQDAREGIGFSRNQLGDFQSRRGDTSAAEATYVAQGSEVRVDEKRDTLADMIVELVTEVNELIFDLWTQTQVVDIVGPGGVPIWVQVNPSLLREGRYLVKVDPDSSVSRSRQQREAKAIGIYNLLKANPFIDPMKLTQYLLREIEGVEMDDLMRALPPMQMNPGVVSPMGLVDIMRQQVGAAQRGAPNPMLGMGG